MTELPPPAETPRRLIRRAWTLPSFAGLAVAALGGAWLVWAAEASQAALEAGVLPAALLVASGLALAAVGAARSADAAATSRRAFDRQDREIQALREAMPVIFGELSLEATLQRVVDRARQLLEADLGALSVMDDKGSIVQFITSGLSRDAAKSIGGPPQGRGLLGIPLFESRGLRVANVAADPRSSELPAGHPPIATLLAVPVANPVFRANLYLSNGSLARPFSADDERVLRRFADLAAFAIELSHLHEELSTLAVEQERLRIAREMHDGMAQVLAYVNTKAQAVQQHVRRGRLEEADANLNQLAEAAREVYSEVRESILGLRTLAESPEVFSATIEEYLRKWEVHTGVSVNADLPPAVRAGGRTALELLRILQESLANVRKHAQATEVRVGMVCDGERVTLTVRDNGRGFDVDSNERISGRYGLVTMRERAHGVGGTISIESQPGTGTLITAEVPLGVLEMRGPS
jgi:signal transduction histidine kinase